MLFATKKWVVYEKIFVILISVKLHDFYGKCGVLISRGKMLHATSSGCGLLSLLVSSSAGGNTVAYLPRYACYVSLAHRGSRREDNWLTLKLIWIWVASLSFGKYIFFHYLTICLCIPYTVMIVFMEMKLFHRTSIEISAFLFSSTISHFDTLTRVISVIYPV